MTLSPFLNALLRKLPQEPQAGITANALALQLRSHWGGSSSLASMRRKISNNIHKIEKSFPGSIEVDDSEREYTYRLKFSAPMLLKPMSQEQQMAFGLLRQYGTDLLTEEAQTALAPLYLAAQNAAAADARESGRGSATASHLATQWLQKIAVVPAVLPFCPPRVDTAVRHAVHQALLLETRLKLTMIHSPSGSKEECEVSPLALVQKGVRIYLVAKRLDQPDAERFLLARILEARHAVGQHEKPARWSLKKFLRQGIGHPVFPPEYYGRVESLVLKVDADTQWLKETPLAPNPIIEDRPDGGYLFKVDLPMTESLCHWLLSMAFHVQVIEPAYLAERIQNDLQLSLNMYTRDAST